MIYFMVLIVLHSPNYKVINIIKLNIHSKSGGQYKIVLMFMKKVFNTQPRLHLLIRHYSSLRCHMILQKSF